MGGIIGKLSFDRHVAISHATVQRMIDAVAHRGGGVALWRRATYVGPGIALASCGDTAGPDPHAAQNETGTVRAVADSDLSNAASLRCLLEDRGHVFRGFTDAEVIAHAYQEWGDACVERFAGAFALAIWDEVTRRLGTGPGSIRRAAALLRNPRPRHRLRLGDDPAPAGSIRGA